MNVKIFIIVTLLIIARYGFSISLFDVILDILSL